LDLLAQLFSNGQLVDAVIALTLLEGAALAAYHHTTGRGLTARDYALNLVSGLCLMLALRNALVQSGWVWVALCLSAAGLAHGADLVCRWQRQRQ
jgi:hypothetical protein